MIIIIIMLLWSYGRGRITVYLCQLCYFEGTDPLLQLLTFITPLSVVLKFYMWPKKLHIFICLMLN